VEEVRLIEVKEEILADNIKVAAEVRERFRKTKTMLLNLMSSPGSGKTSLILQTVANLNPLSYMVDGLRALLVTGNVSRLPLDVVILVIATFAMSFLSAYMYPKVVV